ncbi:MAG TPA: bifunctional DNA primase/polymerase [Stellaceae bacterium]|nr:bifunctional DNA primase/polymerase [Stellaceae bacterium]
MSKLNYPPDFCKSGRDWKLLPLHWPLEDGRCSCGKSNCTSVGKHPLTRHGVKDASSDSKVIAEWWQRYPDANVGIATGAASGIFVLDIDPRHGGKDTLFALEKEHGDLPRTLTARTGEGWHLYFQHVGGLRNRVGALGPGLDIRTDDGYVVGPPSLHANGKCYRWIDRSVIAAAPEWLIARLLSPAPHHEADAGGRVPDQASLKALIRVVATAPEGKRNSLLFWAACQVGKMVRTGLLSPSFAIAIMAEAGVRAGLPDWEARRTAQSGVERGSRDAR